MGGGARAGVVLRIAYVLESLALSGGVKDVVEQANGLAARGHDVVLVSKDEPGGWVDVDVPVRVVPDFGGDHLPESDVHVATWFPTVLPAVRARRARVVLHFSQGWEALYPNTAARAAEIHAAYAAPVPKLLLSEALVEPLAERYPGRLHVLGPAIRCAAWAPGAGDRPGPRDPATIGVIGPWEVAFKGVDVALGAVARLRAEGRRVRLFRASQTPLTAAETRLARADDYRHLAPVADVIASFHEMDLLLFASFRAEGLGLPPFEALAAGVPAVVTDIPSLRVLEPGVVSKVAPGDAEGLAREAGRLLDDPALWRERRQRGLEAVRRFDLEVVLDRLEGILADELRRAGGDA